MTEAVVFVVKPVSMADAYKIGRRFSSRMSGRIGGANAPQWRIGPVALADDRNLNGLHPDFGTAVGGEISLGQHKPRLFARQ